MIHITLVFSPRPREVQEVPLTLNAGCTAGQALDIAYPNHLANAMPSMSSMPIAGVGLWGKRILPDYVLRDGDRLEVYRALTVDPKVARRERFAKQGVKKKTPGLFAQRRAGAKPGY